MPIRNFQTGDESAQVDVYNAAASGFIGFKPATTGELIRRTRAADFDPADRPCAVEDGRVVGYISVQHGGRIGYPWCLPGYEKYADELFEAGLARLREMGEPVALAAYRADWPSIAPFFLGHGFRKSRDMVNLVLDLADLPTISARPSLPVTPLTPDDVPALLTLAPGLLRLTDPAALTKYLFENPYFPADSLVAMRTRLDPAPAAVGLVIENPTYADPRKVDSAMPCFRLGAFGTEGLAVKRINGLFSFLVGDRREAMPLMLDLMGYAANKLDAAAARSLAAQVPSDQPRLLAMYQRFFTKQGSFPVYEREL